MLDLRGLTATASVAADQLATPPLPSSPGVATSLTAALARADYVHAKGQGGNAGVRAEQMAALAVAILETAALQAGRSHLCLSMWLSQPHGEPAVQAAGQRVEKPIEKSAAQVSVS